MLLLLQRRDEYIFHIDGKCVTGPCVDAQYTGAHDTWRGGVFPYKARGLCASTNVQRENRYQSSNFSKNLNRS